MALATMTDERGRARRTFTHAELDGQGREDDLARYFAQRMPDEAHAGRREKLSGGALRLHWRIIRVVAA